MTGRILIADDEPDIVDALAYALSAEGYEVDTVTDGEAALEAAEREPYDMIVLDIMMPRLSGTEVCRRLRTKSIVPIMMLTARDAELDLVLGLEVGADDYVTKPFSVAELVGRVHAILRRRDFERTAMTGAVREIGGLRIDLARHRVEIEGVPVQLTRSELKLLVFLAERPEQVFSRTQVMEHLWETLYVGDARACDVHVYNLRQKIEADPSHPARLVTVRDVGYKLI
ncbi:MAG: response regulator transcription factor, partial [Actinobacteria bacterium]|nr:response regulator transcription factor [Actinomycetota bacterium]